MKYQKWENLARKYNRLWVQKYSLGPTRREVLKIVLPKLQADASLKLFEAGCGTGQLIQEIAGQYPQINYLGIDAAQNMIELAKESAKGENIRFQTCPIENFASTEKYDIILCTHAFPYFPNKEETLCKFADLCNPGATVIIVNSSTNSFKDLLINFFLKATTSKARYLSVKEMKILFQNAGLNLQEVKVIREKFYMPTIALFHLEK
ncbi:MAG: methyltransferase domain-containing protein [Lachnospiraceae bacterium]|nr:methyltransferase domain-containing protein [Lachnospiraceae bacterium]